MIGMLPCTMIMCGISAGGMKRTEEEKRVKREERRKKQKNGGKGKIML